MAQRIVGAREQVVAYTIAGPSASFFILQTREERATHIERSDRAGHGDEFGHGEQLVEAGADAPGGGGVPGGGAGGGGEEHDATSASRRGRRKGRAPIATLISHNLH